MEAGGDAYLTIPVDPEVLVAQVHSLLRLSQTEHRLRRTARQAQEVAEALRTSAEAQRASEEQFALLTESARDFAMIFTDPARNVVRWSAGAQNIFGWAEGEVIGQRSDLIFTPEDRAAGAPQREQDCALFEGRAEDERWHLKKDSGLFWARRWSRLRCGGSGTQEALRHRGDAGAGGSGQAARWR